MLELLACAGEDARSIGQFSEAEGGVETGRPSVLKHDGEIVIDIRDCGAGGRAQDQRVWTKLEFDRNVRWNHGTMSGLEVGKEGSRADSLAVERYRDSDGLVRCLRPYRTGDDQTGRT